MTPGIRFVALGAVWREDELLVFEGQSPQTDEPFYRLLGGGVEFGEHSQDTVVREFEEELGVEFANPTHIGTFEQVFTFNDETGHEIWRVYEGHIIEDWPYNRDSFTFVEPDLGVEHRARWMPIDRLQEDHTTFYTQDVLTAMGH